MTNTRVTEQAADEPSATIHVSLTLMDFDVGPDEITSELGMLPTRAGVKGEPARTRSGRVTSRSNPRSFWTVDSGLPSSATYEQHVRALLDAVASIGPKLSKVELPAVKQIYCTIIPNGRIPILRLDHETLKRIAETGCSIVVDVLYIDPLEE